MLTYNKIYGSDIKYLTKSQKTLAIIVPKHYYFSISSSALVKGITTISSVYLKIFMIRD